jgi:protein-disulfide isomerase
MRPLLVLLVLAKVAFAGSDGFDPKVVYKVPLGDAPVVGPADAPITIVVWSDYACGYCNRVQGTLDHLERLYPGLLRWVHRTLPLDDDYTLAAEASLAADAQGKFKLMHSRLFALRGRVTRAEVELVARELGLDMMKFRADLDAGTYLKQIKTDMADAEVLGISGTPTFFINGRPVIGSEPMSVFASVVDEELARAEMVRAKRPANLYAALVADGRTTGDTPDADREETKLDDKTAYRVGLGLPGHQLGPDDALVTIVEWSDFQCPFCQKMAPVLAHVREKYGDQVRIIYRHMPMAFHKNAMLAAEAGAAAAAQGKFWPFYDEVWKNFGHLTRADLESFAQTVGLDMVKFRAALDDRRYHDAVVAEAAAAEAIGVTGTPTLFINGHPSVGSRDAATMDKLLDSYIADARAMVARGLPKSELYPMYMSSAEGNDRADPSAIPATKQVHIELHAADRARSVIAACRRHDADRAKAIWATLESEAKLRTATACASEGIDLL